MEMVRADTQVRPYGIFKFSNHRIFKSSYHYMFIILFVCFVENNLVYLVEIEISKDENGAYKTGYTGTT